MTDLDVFERDLETAIRRYAAEAPTVDDPAGFATSLALEHPRRRGFWAPRDLRRARTIGWILLGAALILATIFALAAVGGGRLRQDPIAIIPTPPPIPRQPMPDELFGRREASVTGTERFPAGTYTLDVNTPVLLHGPQGEPLDWAGAAVEFIPSPDGGDVVIAAAGPCGLGRYHVGTGPQIVGGVPAPSPDGGEPTPAPGVTALQQVGDGARLVLTLVRDDCLDRFRILSSGPWETQRTELVAGQRYDSMTFTEPFGFVMPSAQMTLASLARPWGKGMFTIGNGWDWRTFFLDDVAVGADPCEPDLGRLADIPATPREVEAWLRSSAGLRVGKSANIEVDGRAALVIPIEVLEGCHDVEPPLEPGKFYLGSRVYAIPTGDDVILFTAINYGMQGFDEAADELVRSITFK